jgi:hypothetical protein
MRYFLTALALGLLTGCVPMNGYQYAYEDPYYYEDRQVIPFYGDYYRSAEYAREHKRLADAAEMRYRNAAQDRGDLRAVFNSVAGSAKGGRDRYYWNRPQALSYRPISHSQGIYPSNRITTWPSVSRPSYSRPSYRPSRSVSRRSSSRVSHQPRRSSRRH